jgi:hypothetical protein
MILICAKCGSKHPLSEEDVAFFYPRFFCLGCGEKLIFPVSADQVDTLRRNNDRDRTLSDVNGSREDGGTIRRFIRDAGQEGTHGG